MLSALRSFVWAQWESIDTEYRTERLPSGKAAAVLLTVAVGLVLPTYLGKPTSVLQWERARLAIEALEAGPTRELIPHLYWALFKLVNYFLVPVLCIKLVLRERVADFGFSLKHSGRVWALYAAMAVLVLPLAYLASHSAAFLRTYPKFPGAGHSWTLFFTWELAYGLQFFLLEFFFRGFMLFALARYVGSLAIAIMVVPYAMIHFGKPAAECVGSVFAGLVLGTIALRTRSIYGGVMVHCAVAWSMDAFALLQKGQLPR